MKKIGIETPCSEDWSKMAPSEKGAFCQKCVKQVHDFSTKSLNEIKLTLLELSGQSVCARMTTRQEDELNAEFKAWLAQKKHNPQQLFITALLIVFGLTLFSCEDERDRQKIESVKQIAYNIASDQTAKLKSAPVLDMLISAPAPSDLIEIGEDYIMGGMPLEFVQDPPPREKPQVMESYMVGGIGSTMIYRNFLQETIPEVETDENGIPYPKEFKAFVFPNPAAGNTTLEIQVPQKERMEITLYDTGGKLINKVYSGEVSRGIFRQLIDLNDLTSGLYLVIVQSTDFKETVRIVKN